MSIKKKHILVVVFSSIIIAAVFISTLVGYTLYIQWKKDSFALMYRDSIYKLTAELFKNDIILSNVYVKLGTDGALLDVPLLEGSLKNNSAKTITSVMIEVSFVRQDGTVVYNDWFQPLGKERFTSGTLFSRMRGTKNVLLPGEGLSFRHILRNCPRKVFEAVSTKAEFAKEDSAEKINVVYKVAGLSVL